VNRRCGPFDWERGHPDARCAKCGAPIPVQGWSGHCEYAFCSLPCADDHEEIHEADRADALADLRDSAEPED
jgi:hypothetical protein